MNRSRTESLQTLFGGISAITGIVSVVISVAALLTAKEKSSAGLLDQIGLPSAIWLPVVLVLSLLLLVAGGWLLWRGLSHKSRLLRPERLRIDPDNPSHLRGRADEIHRLAEAVAAQPLVFLEGESGAGKSALIRSGLIPALLRPPGVQSARTMLPIYLNSYGGDWAQGLQERLVDAFWHQLGQDLRRQLAIENRDALHGQLLSAPSSPLLKRIRTELGWIPLVIFDQFDDYQVANRDRFLREGRWIHAHELVAANPVWERIGQEIERGSLHLLFITRRDLVSGLEAVRFENPELYALDRVQSADMAALLDDLTVPESKDRPVILHPNAGWDSLKPRLISDLSEQHRILPIQARVVFRGLTRLPVLNTAAYERRGGLEGLEAAHVEDAMGAAAGAAGLTMAQTLALLLNLVDDSDPDAPKARSLPAADLAATDGIGGKCDRVLSVLDQEGIVRRHAREDADESPVWSLYHDYLARAVLAAHRRANRWQRLLQERLRTMRDAGSWMARWRNLLSPWEQLRLLGATLTGKLRWTGYRHFAALSGLRWLPFLLLVVMAGVGTDQALEWQARQESQRILTAIKASPSDQGVGGEGYRKLWMLASASPRLKRVFLEQSILDTQSHAALLKHLEPVAQSLFGLDPDLNLRQQALELVFAHKPMTRYRAELATLVYQSVPKVFATQAPRIVESISALIQATTDPEELKTLGRMMIGLGERLPAKQAQAGALRLVEAMDATEDPDRLSWLGWALGKLGERLPAEQAQAGALRLVEVMDKTIDLDQLGKLGRALIELGERLSAEQVQSVALRLVEVMITIPDPWQLSELGEVLGKLGERLPAEQAQAGALRLVEVMIATTDPWQLSRLGWALGKLGERLPAEQAQSGALRLVEVMDKTTDPWQLRQLSGTLGKLGERLPAEQAQSGALRLVEAMGTTTDPSQLSYLDWALDILGERLSDEQAQSVALRLVEAAIATTDPQQLGWLGRALGKLGEGLPAEQAQSGALQLVEVMITTTGPRQLSQLGAALGGLGERLPAEQAQSVALRLVEVMDKTTGLDQLGELGRALIELGERLSAEQAQSVALRLVEVMGTTTDSSQLSELGETLGKLGERLPAEQVQSVALRLVEIMGTTTEPSQLSRLGEALGKLGERLPAAQAQSGALRLVEVMITTTDPWQLGWLSAALGKLGERLPAKQAQSAALRLVEVMDTTEPWQLRELGAALGKLGERLPAEQAQAGALRLIEVISTTTDPDQLIQLGLTLRGLGGRLPAEQAQSVALRLLEVMITTTEPRQLSQFGKALGKLGERLPAKQAQAGALRLVEVMDMTTDPRRLSELGEALGELGERLPAEQAQSGALRLVEVMITTTDLRQLGWLGEALGKLGEWLPAEQVQPVALRLVEVMRLKEITSEDFVSLAAKLGELAVAKDAAGTGIDTAPDPLQAPMAFGKTRERLLRYYSRLAGVFETAEAFRTTDDLVAWVREHRPSLDLTRPPRNPFR